MTHPVNWPKKTFFYPIGNTPPVCFTQDLAPEENAEILLLACGDPRSILYTVHADLAPDFRNLDITCCDWEPAILARNILLLTMITDDVSPVDAWPIFYHFFLDRNSYNILLAQCRTLVQSASDMRTWKSSKYGAHFRFCTDHSLAEIRRHWVLYLESGDLSDKDQKVLKRTFNSGMKSVLDRSVNVISALRSAGPVGVFSIHDLGPKSFRTFWTTGVTSATSASKTSPPFVNPTFVHSLSGKHFNVHYGTDPILAFHLAPVMGDIKGAQSSPTLSPNDLVASSMDQFRSWCSSFKRRLASGSKANIIIRFFVGETLAFCRALAICKELQVTNTGVYVSPWSGMQISFDPEEYGGPSTTAPLAFSVIDTSNLTDHAGLLNILIATVPLLQRRPWAVLYTNTLVVNTFDNGAPTSGLTVMTEKACGDIPTLSILLGVAPSPNLFHFTTHSNKHEVIASSITSSQSGLSQIHEPLAWRFPASVIPKSASFTHAHDYEAPQPSIACNATELAEFLFSVYLQMFAAEDQFQNLRDLGRGNSFKSSYRKQVNEHYTRASFIGLLALVRARVQTEWSIAMDRFMDLVGSDRTLLMGLHAYQDLVCELYMRNLYSLDIFDARYLERVRGPRDRFLGWNEVPPIVCIALKVPRHYLKPFEDLHPDEIMTPMLQCESGNGSFHNIHTSIQLIFGELEVSNVAGERSATIKEDPKGWEGKSPLIATFYLPSWILTVTPKETKIGLHVRDTPQSLMTLMGKLGMRLTIYSTSLSDTVHVEVLRQRPDNIGEVDRTRRLSSPALSRADDVTMKFDSFGRKATTLTIRNNIRDAEAAKSLADKAEVTIKPLADCTILASFAEHQRHFIFPFPVRGADSKLKIARKSLYLEIEAPIRPHFEDFLDLSLNPFSIYRDNEHINLHNVHYLKLDLIPALKLPSTKQKLQWLSTHMGMTLSETEKKVKDRPNQSDRGAMVNLKESIATIILKYSGLADPRDARMPFGLCNPVKGVGVYTLIFVNDIKLDVASHTVVVDACVVPLIEKIMPKVSPVLGKLSNRGLIQIVTLEDETRAWRLLLPAFAERCRTWKHLDTCEYRTEGIPAEVDGLTVSPLCGCGRGKNLGSFGNVPEWKLLHREATRVAIGPLFSFSFMEGTVAKLRETLDGKVDEKIRKTNDAETRAGGGPSSSSNSPRPQCARCGGPGKPTLQACSVCKSTKYCSKDCQKNDWRTHKLQCIRAS
ncbi:hypothetical protein M413DRAFT_449391 [Hebeloma cylindrosporum]|uniref:MYND-type domain-containing protein n=1 Tax=Hebeloma cylindrosporum TaxID=76867 RepID=A0A0C2XDS3_HEBCY|nr:hypothetical protein M413DRAFT_449391 [Hebeloma cylindrosporum h7]